MTKTMLITVALMIGVGAVLALAGRILRREKVVAYGVAIIGAGALLFCYDVVALAF